MLAIIHGCKKMNLRTEACFPGQELQAELTSGWWWPVRDPVVSLWRPDAPRQLRAGPDRAKSNHRNSEERTGTWANEQRKNVVHRLKETATKTTRTRMKLNESLSNLAERITTELRSYPEKNYCPIPTQTLGNPHLVQEHNFSPKKRNLLEIWCTSGIDEFQLVGLFITRQSISQAKQKCSKASEPTDRTYEQKGKPGEHTQEHEHTKNDSNFQSPEVTLRLGPHFPTKNSHYTDQFVVHLWTSHSRTTQRRKP